MTIKDLRLILSKFKDDVQVTIHIPSYTIKTRSDIQKVIDYDEECILTTDEHLQGGKTVTEEKEVVDA
jgi:hypothetical protein